MSNRDRSHETQEWRPLATPETSTNLWDRYNPFTSSKETVREPSAIERRDAFRKKYPSRQTISLDHSAPSASSKDRKEQRPHGKGYGQAREETAAEKNSCFSCYTTDSGRDLAAAAKQMQIDQRSARAAYPHTPFYLKAWDDTFLADYTISERAFHRKNGWDVLKTMVDYPFGSEEDEKPHIFSKITWILGGALFIFLKNLFKFFTEYWLAFAVRGLDSLYKEKIVLLSDIARCFYCLFQIPYWILRAGTSPITSGKEAWYLGQDLAKSLGIEKYGAFFGGFFLAISILLSIAIIGTITIYVAPLVAFCSALPGMAGAFTALSHVGWMATLATPITFFLAQSGFAVTSILTGAAGLVAFILPIFLFYVGLPELERIAFTGGESLKKGFDHEEPVAELRAGLREPSPSSRKLSDAPSLRAGSASSGGEILSTSTFDLLNSGSKKEGVGRNSDLQADAIWEPSALSPSNSSPLRTDDDDAGPSTPPGENHSATTVTSTGPFAALSEGAGNLMGKVKTGWNSLLSSSPEPSPAAAQSFVPSPFPAEPNLSDPYDPDPLPRPPSPSLSQRFLSWVSVTPSPVPPAQPPHSQVTPLNAPDSSVPSPSPFSPDADASAMPAQPTSLDSGLLSAEPPPTDQPNIAAFTIGEDLFSLHPPTLSQPPASATNGWPDWDSLELPVADPSSDPADPQYELGHTASQQPHGFNFSDYPGQNFFPPVEGEKSIPPLSSLSQPPDNPFYIVPTPTTTTAPSTQALFSFFPPASGPASLTPHFPVADDDPYQKADTFQSAPNPTPSPTPVQTPSFGQLVKGWFS